MRELKLQVERAVRPVRASARRKDRMREELFSHLTAVYEEELSGGVDPSAALAKAIRRFGDPAEVRRELQSSVPRLERVLWWRAPSARRYNAVARWAGRWRAEGSPFAFAARVTGATGLLWIGTSLPVLLLAAIVAVGHGSPAWPFVGLAAHFFGALVASLLVAWFLGALCVDRIRRAMLRGRTWRAAAWSVAAAPIALGAAALFRPLAPTSLPPDALGYVPAVDFAACFVPFFGAGVVAAPLLAGFTALSGLAARRRYDEWESLPVDEG